MNKKYYLLIGLIVVAIALVIGTSYAYFMANVTGGDNGSETVIKSGNLSLTLEDETPLTLNNAQPGSSASKTFTVTNTSKNTMVYNIKLVDVTNTFIDKNDLVYTLIGDNDINITEVVPSENNKYLATNIPIEAGITHTYTLTITFKETNDNQNDNMGVSFSGRINIDDETNTLIGKLLKQYQSSNTTGLIKDTNNPNLYYYTGSNDEVSNNFLWYGGHQWRVIEMNREENTLTLITQQPLTAIQTANSVWTNEESYDQSYINSWLNDYFWNSLDSSIQSNILDNTFNVGIYNGVDEITITEKVGLLDENQYTRTKNINSFLNINDTWWLGNRFDETSIAAINGYGNRGNLTLTYAVGVRPVIKISNIIITDGNGSLTSSYKCANIIKNVSDIQVGEYIQVPYDGNNGVCGSDNMCLFRVVSKDNDSVKIILNGLLPNPTLYGNSTTITTDHIIYNQLNDFVNNISDKYKYANNKNFYIGEYPSGATYESVKNEILKANVGLITVGEMFSGNDIDSNEDRTFVDINTIENSNISGYVWTMNRYSSDRVRDVNKSGYLSLHFITSSEYYIRPVLFLKNNLTLTGGEGTAQNPYTLE